MNFREDWRDALKTETPDVLKVLWDWCRHDNNHGPLAEALKLELERRHWHCKIGRMRPKRRQVIRPHAIFVPGRGIF